MIPERHLEILRLIWKRLQDQPLIWVITGSVGMALQGMEIEVHDIDLQTDLKGAYFIEKCLLDFVTLKIDLRSSERVRSYLGKFLIDGMQVEVIGDIQKLAGTEWEPAPDLAQLQKWVEVQGMRLPVLDLEYEYQAYQKMGREEKARKIRQFLDKAC